MRFGHKRSWIYAAFALALAIGFGINMSLNTFATENTEYNLTGVIALSTYALPFANVLGGLGGAMEGARLRGGRYESNLSFRRHWRVVLDSIGPIYIAMLLAQLVVFFYWLPRTHGFFSAFPIMLPLASVFILSAHILLGFNLGLRLPSMVSLPLAMVTPLMWLSLAASSDFFVLRFLAGQDLGGSCCRIYQQPIPRVLFMGLVFNLVATVFLYFWADVRKVRSSVVKWASKSIIGLGSIALVAWLCTFNVPATGIEDRSFREMTCSGHSPVVCLFQNQDPKGESATTLAKTWFALREVNPDIAPAVVGVDIPDNPHFLPVVVTPSSKQQVVAFSLTSNFTGSQANCREDAAISSARDASYGETLNFLLGRVQEKTGLDVAGWYWPLSPAQQAEVTKAQGLSTQAQIQWLQANRAFYPNCASTVIPKPLG